MLQSRVFLRTYIWTLQVEISYFHIVADCNGPIVNCGCLRTGRSAMEEEVTAGCGGGG